MRIICSVSRCNGGDALVFPGTIAVAQAANPKRSGIVANSLNNLSPLFGVVVLKGESPRLFKIQRTINGIIFDDLYNLIENPLPCC